MTAVTANPRLDAKAEELATKLCHFVVGYASVKKIDKGLAERAGVDRTTVSRMRHFRIRHFPSLLTFVKLLAACDLEIQIVRADHGLSPDDPQTDYTQGVW